MPRPTPCAPPISASAAMISSGASACPLRATGKPWSKLSVSMAGASGASAGAVVSMKALSGGYSQESSVSPPPMVVPSRPLFTE